MHTATIIASGTELTLGQTVDTNSAWLARELAAGGVRCTRIVIVADDLAAIRAAILEASAASDLTLLTGGLGPTEDDLTRQALAEASADVLVSDAESLRQVEAFFAARRRPMPERNRVQALRPSRATAIANPCGTAPGLEVILSGRSVIALPGVPFEMKAMFDLHVRPRLAAWTGGRVIRSRVLRCFGLGESEVGARLEDLMQRGRNPEVGTTAALGIIGVRINADAAAAAECERMLDETEALVRARLGGFVFGVGDQTLAEAVGEHLVRTATTVCTAESCTGGLIAKLLTDVPGSSRYFVGGAITYSNALKERVLGVSPDLLERRGAVSEPVAGAMAAGALRAFGATYALSATGIAGPDGGTDEKPVGLVYVALAAADGVQVQELHLGSDAPRDAIRVRTAQAALNLLRLRFVEPPR